MTKYLIIFEILFNTFIYGQSRETIVLPSPKIGWDSLTNYIVYPELARRSGLQGLFKAQLTIDSAGTITNLKIINEFNYQRKQDDTTMMDIMLLEKMRSTAWNPATIDGRKISHDLIIPFFFLIEHPDQTQPIIKIINSPKFIKPENKK